MIVASAEGVRATIARLVLGERSTPRALGSIVLRPHQRSGVDRLRHTLERARGALLADDVGLGKTFVALAIAREARLPLVIAPAALRANWTAASERAGVPITFLSMESLGRSGATQYSADLVIVDEAHHFRSPDTRRFAAAREICRDARVLLLTATPVQNRLADVRVILSLFLGERAHALGADELSACIVRRLAEDVDADALPSVREPRWIRSVEDMDCLDRLLSLPPPLPPRDAGDGGVLVTYTLARQWASSRGALRSALQRRLARAAALDDALRAGRMPTGSELRAWCFAEGAQQLAFPELVADAAVSDAAALREQVNAHADGVRDLLAWLGHAPDADDARADALARVLADHPGERVIAFAEFTETVASLYRLLAPRVRAAMLTHTGGRVAGGPMSRAELLARFAPGSPLPLESERIDLLLTTDVLSEGVDLQTASVVVHLDLSWNPARLEQRVGRVRRIGATRRDVTVYLVAPPAPAERLLRMEGRLRVKLGVAGRAIGLAGAILPGLAAGHSSDAAALVNERLASRLGAWCSLSGVAVAGPGAGVAAAVLADRDAVLACVRSADGVSLVALVDGRILTAPAVLDELVSLADGTDTQLDAREAHAALLALRSALLGRGISRVVDLDARRVAVSRRALLRRVDTIAGRLPRHAQPRLAPLVRAARSAAIATLSAGAERVLDELARAPMPDDAWLHAVGEFASLHGRGECDDGGNDDVLALLVLRRSGYSPSTGASSSGLAGKGS